MKKFLKLIIFVLANVSLGFNKKSLPLSIAFEVISNEIFVKLNQPFEVIIYGSSSSYAQEVIDKYLLRSNCIVDVKSIKNIKDWNHQIFQSAIFVIGTIKEAKFLFKSSVVPTKVLPKKFRFLIFIEEIKDEKNLNEIEKTEIGEKLHLSHFSYYVIETKNTIQIFTVNPFREGHCECYEYQKIGSMNKKQLTWSNELKIEEKFTNFHKCMVVFGLNIHTKDFLEKFFLTFFESLSQKGNFTFFIQFESNTLELIPEDGKTLNYHLYFTYTTLQSMFYDTFHVTSTFGNAAHIFVMTPGETFSSYEKMSMPFDDETWTYLGVTFGVAFVVIWILGFAPQKIRQIIIGSKVHHPGFNVIASFFGISQTQTPKENSARIILIFFLFFCLIFRTAYQSVLFEMITSDMRKKLPTSIQELYDKNFTIVIYEPVPESIDLGYLMIQELFPIDRRPSIRVIQIDLFLEYFKMNIQNASAKLAFYMMDDLKQELASELHFTGIQLEQALLSTTCGLGVSKNSFLFHLIDKMVQDLTSTGITLKFYKDIMKSRYLKPLKKAPQVLSVDDVEFGFVVWLISAFVSLILFLVEFFLFKFLFKIKFFMIAKLRDFIGKILVLKGLDNFLLKFK